MAGLLSPANADLTLQRGIQGGEFYIEINQKYNWFQASHECARKGLRLVEIPDAVKNAELISALRTYIGNAKDFWIGANDEYNTANDLQRPFYWSSSGERVTFSNWAINQPDNLENNEHCVQLWSIAVNFEWNDIACTNEMGFICEKSN
ncbi:lectin subunit alpha-like [Musca vetustissima]|uniref:lectin subunit alpha-like n=1 Tax=Musca vetustissima TaxID=27455 RepID=UPI002AB74266|nr:lectin subunit alpha-like [Musca vetustissima]